MREADFYEKLENNRVHCMLCPHDCKIADGKKGVCRVRRNDEGTLIAESYGRITSMAIDPIEKKPLYHFHPGAKILSIGSFGCNFSCGFCQNHEISMNDAPYDYFSPHEIAAASERLEEEGNIGIAYTYNEPLIGWEFIYDCAKLVAAQKQKNVIVSNGFICEEPLKKLLPFIHAMNIDLKSFNQTFYKKIAGCLDDVLRTIEIAVDFCHVEVTTLVIPGENDSEEEIESLAKTLSGIDKDIVFHLSRFFPAYKYQDVSATPIETVYRLAEISKRHLNHVYTGNC